MGYVHDTHMSQFVPPTAMHFVTGTWTQTAGVTTDTIAMHKAAGAETAVVNIPVQIPSNSSNAKGSLLKSIEIDYQLSAAGATSVTAVLNKVARGADGAVATVSAPTITQDLAAGTAAATQDEHKLTVTLTTPEYIDNDVYFLLELTFVCGGTVTVNVLGAVINYTIRV